MHLAVAIGTAHGQYKGEFRSLDFDQSSPGNCPATGFNIPIVLHGSSGVPDEAHSRKAIGLRRCARVNIDTNIREAFVLAARQVLENNPKEIDPRKMLGPARDAAIAIIREKISVFGSSQKA
jgi:fructose-bisphosphate aldolase class II